jgi:hypothetical protein
LLLHCTRRRHQSVQVYKKFSFPPFQRWNSRCQGQSFDVHRMTEPCGHTIDSVSRTQKHRPCSYGVRDGATRVWYKTAPPECTSVQEMFFFSSNSKFLVLFSLECFFFPSPGFTFKHQFRKSNGDLRLRNFGRYSATRVYKLYKKTNFPFKRTQRSTNAFLRAEKRIPV